MLKKFCLLISLLISPISHAVAETITVYYEPSTHYFFDENKRLNGKYYRLGNRIFLNAGFRPIWREGTGTRIEQNLSNLNNRACTIGYRKLPERIGKYRFTNAIAHPKGGSIIVLKKHEDHARKLGSMHNLLTDHKLRGIFLRNTSYDDETQALLDKYRDFHTFVPYYNTNTIRLMKLGRGEFTAISNDILQSKASDYIRNDKSLAFIEYPDLGSADPHYIMCSLAITADDITKLNKAIEEILPKTGE